MNIGPTEAIILLLIVLLLFGATRLPALARSLGQAAAELRAAQHSLRAGDGNGSASEESGTDRER